MAPNKSIDSDQQHQYEFDVEGMSCAACVANVESALHSIEGVGEVSVNLATESAQVTSSTPIPINKFTRTVSKMGYKLEPQGSSSLVSRQQRSISTWKRLLIIQAIFGVPLLVYAMLEMFTAIQIFPRVTGILIQLVLATILVISGSGYYRRGFQHLILRVPNMDSLVALGTGSAYLYSIISTMNLIQGFEIEGFTTLYFEAAGTILLFITFGKWLEALARGKTTEALTGLMDQMPTEAEVKRDGKWVMLGLDQVIIGDEVRVNPHTRIPVDGVVLAGRSSTDESSISGESIPVEKEEGSSVIGASLNLQSGMVIRAEKIGRESMFGQIITLVESAQLKKPEIQKLVDKIAAVFVPIVLSLALLSGLVWLLLGFGITFAINVMISVMIIACPCALGLATPTALVVGSGIAARGGILIKSADAFQQLSKVDIMVFDKTGTLTTADPQVVGCFPVDTTGYFSLAMGLEEKSQHPLARALLKHGTKLGLQATEMENVTEQPGSGIQGYHEQSCFHFRRLNPDEDLPEDFSKVSQSYDEKGFTTSGIFSDDNILGLIAFSDIIKPEGKSVVRALRNRGVESYLLSGDKPKTAARIAKEAGIDNFQAQVLPADKHDEVKSLQNQSKIVGMLGDGINDAPALTVADIGISFKGSTDIAINAADIILLNDSLNHVVYAHRIAQATMGKIRQNLFWAFIYNLAGIPIAMGVLFPFTGMLLNPMFAGLAMAFSSVSVVSNTLLLRQKNYFTKL